MKELNRFKYTVHNEYTDHGHGDILDIVRILPI